MTSAMATARSSGHPADCPGSVAADTPYNVTVSGIGGLGIPTSYSYTVTLFDPNVLNESPVVAGTSTPPTTGAAYSFNSIAQADAYELSVTTPSTAAWTEGAEDPSSQITAMTSGAMRQTAVKRTGSKAFQLTFPDRVDQSFVIARDVIPSASSFLQFYDLGRFSKTTTTLDAEISTNGGDTWTSLWSRNGVGLSSAYWDPAFVSRSVSLAAYAGQIVRVRFILRRNGPSVSIGTSENYGFFIDDVTVTNATELVNGTTTPLAAPPPRSRSTPPRRARRWWLVNPTTCASVRMSEPAGFSRCVQDRDRAGPDRICGVGDFPIPGGDRRPDWRS